MNIVQKEKIITARGLVEKERKSLIDYQKRKDFKSWLDGREYPLDWMKRQYGETLTEKDGFTYPNGDRFSDADCNVCGRGVEPDEPVVHLSFSFCDEYSCGMNICRGCLVRLNDALRKTQEENV